MKALWCFEAMGITCQLTEHSTPEDWNVWGRWHTPTSTHICSPNKLPAVWQIVSFLSSYFQRTFKISKCEYTCTNLHRNRWFWQVMAVVMCQHGRGWFERKCWRPHWYWWLLPVMKHLFTRQGVTVAVRLRILQGLTVTIHCLSLNFCSKWVGHDASLQEKNTANLIWLLPSE
jgi:hypothetical protein